MPNRYANLTPSAKISQEYTKITEGFDKVQSEIDQRIAKDSDLQSQITQEQQQRIAADNAHKNDTKAHPAENITYSGKVSGATNVKQAADKLNDRIDNIVAQGGSDNTEVVDARMGADGVARPTLGTLVREIHAQQIDSARQTVTLKRGQNIVTTDQASPAEMKIFGRTMVNLLGRVGGCESLAPLNRVGSSELSQERYRSGQYAIKFTANGQASYVTYNSSVTLDKSKYYLLAAWVYTESLTGNGTALVSLRDYGTQNARYITQISVSDVGKWKLLLVKVPTNNTLVGNGFTLLFGFTGSAPTGVAYFDEVRLYEVTAEEYAAIGTTIVSDGEIDAMYPYVDDVQHVTNPVITKLGKNLLPPFTQWTKHSNATVVEPYKLQLNATGNYQITFIDVPCLPGTKYTLSCSDAPRMVMSFFDAGGNYLSETVSTNGRLTATSPANAVKLRIELGNAKTTGIFTFTNPQLEIGEVATPFEPRNDDHIYAECTLRSLPNGVRDVLDVESKQKTSLVGVLDLPTTGWIVATNNDSFVVLDLNIVIPNFKAQAWADLRLSNSFTFSDTTYVAMDTSSHVNVLNLATRKTIALHHLGTHIYFAIPRSEFTYTLDNAGANAFVQAKLAGTSITYQLANPITETVPVEGAIALHDGQNIIEVGEGVIIREKTTPQYSSLEGGYYFLNVKSSYWGVDHKFRYPAENVLKVYRDDEEFTRWSKYSTPSSTYGRFGVVIKASDFVPGEYSVTYIASKYMMTANIVDATMTYNTNQKMVVDALTRDMADAKTEISIHDRILAEYAARLLALEEGV